MFDSRVEQRVCVCGGGGIVRGGGGGGRGVDRGRKGK